jgi:type VI secretion system protein ImpF
MPDLTPQERLQPSLLDRLTDDKPDVKQEPREARVMSLKKLREAVVRDLVWLLNAGNFEDSCDLSNFPHAARSVLNYGMPDLSGCTASSIDVSEMERILRQCIWDFEPRILRNTVKVRVLIGEHMNRNALTFEIEGELWAEPVPDHLFLKTELDLETGNVTIEERAG